MKKIILLAPTPPPYGGIAGWVCRMLNTRLKHDWSIIVVDEKVIGGRAVFGEKSKKNLAIEIKRCMNIWKSLRLELKDPDVKIVQACIPAGKNSMLRECVSGIITRIYGKKFIVHFRCTLPNMVKSFSEIFLFKILVKLSHDVFVLNNSSDYFMKRLCKRHNCEVIPNFIEINEVKSKEFFHKEIKTIVYVGGVIPEKGCDQIYEIAPEFPDIQFRLVGNVGMGNVVVPDNVVLLGEQPKEIVQKELMNADVFMFLSRYYGEGFSNALAEAMAYELPCIVTDWAANKDMIENKGGIVVPLFDINSVKEAIIKLDDPSIRQKMGEWNRKKILENYSKEIVTDLYVEAYDKLSK